jgi:hypothetical protein
MCTISIFICRTSHSLFIFLNTRSLTFVKLGYNKLTQQQQQQKKDNNLIQFYCLNIKCKDLKIYFHNKCYETILTENKKIQRVILTKNLLFFFKFK